MLKIEFPTLTLSLTHLQKRHTHTLLLNRNLGENVDFSKVKTQAYRQFFASPEKLKKS